MEQNIQTQQLPATYNFDEAARKIEQEKQLLDLAKHVDHLIALMEGDRDTVGFTGRLVRLETTLYGKDYINGIVQRVDELSKMKVWILCTLSALGSSGLTIAIAYLVKHI
jgi:hypothetical protein